MSQYSAQILICFIAYIFQLFYSSVGLLGNFAGLPVCTVPSAIVHYNQNEAAHQTIKAPSNALLRCSWPIKTLSGIYVTDWWNGQIKWMKSLPMGSFQSKNQVNGESFAYLWVILLYVSLESRLISTLLELGQVRLFWKLIRSRIWQLSQSCQTGVWE